ncbi:hypothetical protein B0H63DRAFT_528646 [Podospora didyma]|uniref:Uncharacterized protein n=1 Tax=Podospora didyma TaxID=330526 RepID=A0AAE0N2A4_9PEZI|nr:hypothetical protein B0H63DRAFT_528646 [Podospora didyma]
MSTWDSESDDNINEIIPSTSSTVRVDTIEADTLQIAADAAAVAAIWTFGLGMAAYAVFETEAIIEKGVISSKAKELNGKLTAIDANISARINQNVNLYVIQYKSNNDLIASKAPKGLDARTCRSILMQFMAQVHEYNGTLDIAGFKKYAEAARRLYNSPEINDVYDALDKLNLSEESDADVQQFIELVKSQNFDSVVMILLRNIAVTSMAFSLNIANQTIRDCAKAAGFEVAEVESSAFGMLDVWG